MFGAKFINGGIKNNKKIKTIGFLYFISINKNKQQGIINKKYNFIQIKRNVGKINNIPQIFIFLYLLFITIN